jgi:hypothetical protein
VSVGKSVRLFLADGTPGGLLTAEIMNWTGHVVAAPRSDLAALLKRTETSRTGRYILLGDDPDSLGGQLAYIGKGDDIKCGLFRDSIQFCLGLVDLVVCVGHHCGGGHRLAVVDKRFEGRVAENIA